MLPIDPKAVTTEIPSGTMANTAQRDCCHSQIRNAQATATKAPRLCDKTNAGNMPGISHQIRLAHAATRTSPAISPIEFELTNSPALSVV